MEYNGGDIMAQSKTDYLEQMKKTYQIDVSSINSLDWFLILAGAAATILCVMAFLYWIITILLFLVGVRTGKNNIRDSYFWKRMSLALILLMLVMGGSMFLIIEQFYNILGTWGWGGS